MNSSQVNRQSMFVQMILLDIFALVELLGDLLAKAILRGRYICFCFIHHFDRYHPLALVCFHEPLPGA